MRASLPTYSVIIPTYGRPVYLRDAISSVLAQGERDLEVIVVDDASPDPVVIPSDPRIHLVRSSVNGGAAAARNLGVEHATGEVLLFLDDDDTWTDGRLVLAAQGLARAPIAVCWQSPVGGRSLEGEVHDQILDHMVPNFGATAVARGAWEPLDTSYRTCEDLVWWLQVTRRNRVATESAQGLVVRQHNGERVGYGAAQRIADSRRLLDEQAAYFRMHPRASAFRWKRIGLMYLAMGQRRRAAAAFVYSLGCRPEIATTGHLIRAVLRP